MIGPKPERYTTVSIALCALVIDFFILGFLLHVQKFESVLRDTKRACISDVYIKAKGGISAVEGNK